MDIYTVEEIDYLREGGKRLAYIFSEIKKLAISGMEVLEIDRLAEKLIREGGDTPAFLNYQPRGASYPYPKTLCISINNEVVHGIHKKGDILKDGDIVGFDLGLIHRGLVTDSAITIGVGNITEDDKRLMNATKEALNEAIKVVKSGNRIGDIGFAIQQVAKKYGYSVVEELGGHGVGHKIHDEPFIPNFGKKNSGIKLHPGMVIAIEPIFNAANKDIVLCKDGYTFKTKDNKKSAHFEHTILITDGEAEVLTKP